MAVAVVVLNILGSSDLKTKIQLLGIDHGCLVIMNLDSVKEAGK